MNISEWLIDSVTRAPRTGYANGSATYGSQVTIKARVEHIHKLVIGADKNEVLSNHRFVTLAACNLSDRIWLPGDNIAEPTAARKILDIHRATDKLGTVTHYEVYL